LQVNVVEVSSNGAVGAFLIETLGFYNGLEPLINIVHLFQKRFVRETTILSASGHAAVTTTASGIK
jgi:hypothetical protein